MTAPAPPDVAEAVRALMPELRRQGLIALGLIVVSIVVSGVLLVLILNAQMESRDRWKLAFFAAGAGVFAAVMAWKWMIRAQERLVMPILARSIGLGYAKDAKAFVKALPKRLLPAGLRGGEDHIHGTLGAHAIQLAEVTVETGGKNSKTLFKGIVAQFPNRTAMPAFFIAREDKTRPGIFFGGDLSTDGLRHLRNLVAGGRTYGIWTSWAEGPEPPALSAVIDILTSLEGRLGPGAELYAATSNGVEMHVALSHSRNLFRLGGLLPAEDRLFAEVQQAMQDLTIPLTLAQALIQAEETAASKG
ncbi:hypothetical protein [Tabrizicola sp.]|uniref:hypothetical protein n=1 Tax=Tabrizicola sp. TaxID=2005166 RepID=UPI002FDDEE59